MFRSRLRADDGFTFVELLVAILIIGILAALGLATFLGQRVKAQDALAKASAAFSIKRSTDGGSVRDCTTPGAGACRDTPDGEGNRW